MGILIAVLRRVLPADATVDEVHKKSSPFVRVVREHPGLIFRGALLGWGSAVAFYLSAVFLSSFLVTEKYLDQKKCAACANIYELGVLCFHATLLFSGVFVWPQKTGFDLFDCERVFAFPMFPALARENEAVDFLVIGVFSFFLAMGFAPFQVWLAEQFPSYLRTSGLDISYNVAAGVLGGTTPLVATALVQFSGSPMAPAALIVVSSLTSMVIAFTMKETANEELR
jgi:MHS family proline/betaine transporter-like MFS transporter